jgi:hypothetical protein
MVRTQIQLSESQARRIKRRAQDRGISMAALIRECVERELEAGEPDRARRFERAARLAGRYRDQAGARDLARKHDRYLSEIQR